MTFKDATDALMAGISTEEIAAAMKVSVQGIRMARSDEDSKSFRSPPQNWESAAARLAEKQAAKLMRLAAKLRSA